MQRRGTRTASDLSTELEVSVRTIYRDIQALQEAGVPLWTESGPGGGIHLMPGWRSPVDGMTGEEASALMFGPAGAADLGMAGVLATARSKVRSGLPTAVGGQIDAIASRFHLDSSGWFRPREPGEFLAVVAEAVWDGVRLDIRYTTGDRTRSRRLDPLGLVLKNGVWYLVAAHRGQVRTYRVQRISEALRREELAQRPADFDLPTYWASTADDLDRRIRTLDTILRIPRTSISELRAHVPGPVTAQAIDHALQDAGDTETLEVALPLERLEVAAAQLAAVPGINVIEPRELRAALHTLGTNLARANAMKADVAP
ncbi:MAG: helix-turn-helix transcriptional regulator [Cumulibacter sp.]